MTEVDKSFLKLRWMLGLRGIFAIIFGVVALSWPEMTLAVLAALYSAYAVVRGGISAVGGLIHGSHGNLRLLILGAGLVSLAAGAGAYAPAELTAQRLMLVMAATETVFGATDIAVAFGLRHTIAREWLLVLSGCLSTALGILMFLIPVSEFLRMVAMIALVSVMTGALLLAFALRSRDWRAGSPRVPYGEPELSWNDEVSAAPLAGIPGESSSLPRP